MASSGLRWQRMAQELKPDPIQGGGTEDGGRSIPWRMVQSTIDLRGVPSMSPELLAYLESATLESEIAHELQDANHDLAIFYAAWLQYRSHFPGGHVSTEARKHWAALWNMSVSTHYRRVKQAEQFITDAVGRRLRANIRKRQEQDSAI